MNEIPSKKLAQYYISSAVLCLILIGCSYTDPQWLRFLAYWALRVVIYVTIITSFVILLSTRGGRSLTIAIMFIAFILATVPLFNKIHGVYIVETNYIMNTVDRGDMSWTQYRDLVDALRPYYRSGVKRAHFNKLTLSEYNTRIGKTVFGGSTDMKYRINVLRGRYWFMSDITNGE